MYLKVLWEFFQRYTLLVIKKIVNYLLLLVSLGVSVLPKEELWAMFTVINLSLRTQILRHKDWVKSN